MTSQILPRISHFNSKIQVKWELRLVPFCGGEGGFLVTRETSQSTQYSFQTPKGIRVQQGGSSLLLGAARWGSMS